MIFVVYSHIDERTTGIISFITPIMIPLFFAITGYLFNGDQKTPAEFFKRMLHRLIVPWLFFAYVQYIPGRLIMYGSLDLLRITWDIISADVLWYMPCCVLAETLFYLINRTIRGFKWRIAACCVSLCIGYILVFLDLGFLFALNVVFIAQMYMMLGQLLRRYENKLNALSIRNRNILIAALAAAYLGMTIANTLLYPDSHLNQRLNVYNCLPLTLAMIIVGCVMVFLLFQSIPSPRWLCFIGRNSLVFYVLHGRFLGLFQFIYVSLKLPTDHVVLASCLVTALTLCCLAVSAMILNRYLPFLGKRNKKA